MGLVTQSPLDHNNPEISILELLSESTKIKHIIHNPTEIAAI